MTPSRILIITATLLLVACSTDSSSHGATSDAGVAAPTATQSEVAERDASDSAPDSTESSTGHRATVTIGDLTWNLHSGGIFWLCAHSDTLIAGNYAVDPDGAPIQPGNPDIGVQINYVLLSPDSTDPQSPMITVQDVEAGTQWQTGEISDVPEAAIVDVSLVGGVATGTAVFFDLASYLAGNSPELVDGTFEIACEP